MLTFHKVGANFVKKKNKNKSDLCRKDDQTRNTEPNLKNKKVCIEKQTKNTNYN